MFAFSQPFGSSSSVLAFSEVAVQWFRDCLSGYLRILSWNSLCPVSLKTF